MPLLEDGWYAYDDDRGFEVETTYYLKFQIKSALFSIGKIFEEKPDIDGFSSKPEYYHYFTDHLLYSLGQINNRFYPNNRKDNLDHCRRAANIINYQFSEDEFPILSNKSARNTIEHIEEYNDSIIKKFKGVGGFNVILDGMSEKAKKTIEGRKDTHPYTLNIVEKTLYILRGQEEISIDLKKLLSELQKLEANVTWFMEIMSR